MCIVFIFQSLIMESLEQLSCNNLEAMDLENDSVNKNVINIDRNKIEAIPKNNQVLKYYKEIQLLQQCSNVCTFFVA